MCLYPVSIAIRAASDTLLGADFQVPSPSRGIAAPELSLTKADIGLEARCIIKNSLIRNSRQEMLSKF